MGEGSLEVDLQEFKKLKKMDRDVLMYKNLVMIRKKTLNDTLNKKIQYVWLIALTAAIGIKEALNL